jgi:hypothetical protein
LDLFEALIAAGGLYLCVTLSPVFALFEDESC